MAEWVSAGIAGVCALASLLSMVHTRQAAQSALQFELALAKFKNELRDWINGSFMRTKEVQTIIESVEHRLDLLEK